MLATNTQSPNQPCELTNLLLYFEKKKRSLKSLLNSFMDCISLSHLYLKQHAPASKSQCIAYHISVSSEHRWSYEVIGLYILYYLKSYMSFCQTPLKFSNNHKLPESGSGNLAHSFAFEWHCILRKEKKRNENRKTARLRKKTKVGWRYEDKRKS